MKKKQTFQNNRNLTGQHTICIIGQKGAGKTKALELIAETIENKKIIIADTTGVMKIKKFVNINGLKANSIQMKLLMYHIDRENKIILDFSSCSQKDGVLIMNTLAEQLEKRKINVALIIDEMAEFCPQFARGRDYSEFLERIARLGRNWNISPFIFSTQRPQFVNKDVLALSDSYVVFRVHHELDREAVRKIMGKKSKTFDAEGLNDALMNLKTRECFIFGNGLPLEKTKTRFKK